MRVLLTGSAGFIGAAVADQLEARGDEVVRVDLMLPMAHGSTGAPDGTHHLDVRDAADWVDLLRGVDVVCHQAALVGALTEDPISASTRQEVVEVAGREIRVTNPSKPYFPQAGLTKLDVVRYFADVAPSTSSSSPSSSHR